MVGRFVGMEVATELKFGMLIKYLIGNIGLDS